MSSRYQFRETRVGHASGCRMAEEAAHVRSGNKHQCSDPVTQKYLTSLPQHHSLGPSFRMDSWLWYRFLCPSESEIPTVWGKRSSLGSRRPGMGNATPAMALVSSLSLPPVPEGTEISSISDYLSLSQTLSSPCDPSTQSGVPVPGRTHRARQPGQEHLGPSGQ